jgi:hypothetical protein
MRALLDVNVLIALLDAGHMHHARATHWLGQEIENGWASCPLTQNGCLRIMAVGVGRQAPMPFRHLRQPSQHKHRHRC